MQRALSYISALSSSMRWRSSGGHKSTAVALGSSRPFNMRTMSADSFDTRRRVFLSTSSGAVQRPR